MRKKLLKLSALLIPVLLPGPGNCFIKSSSECHPLEKIEAASLIVKGEVVKIEERGARDASSSLLNKIIRPGFAKKMRGRERVVTFKTTKSLKGAPPKNLKIRLLSFPGLPMPQLSESEKAILFLIQENGDYFLLDDGKIPAVDDAQDVAVSDNPTQALRNEFFALTKSLDYQEASVGIACLGVMGDPDLKGVLKERAKSAKPLIRSVVVSQLIRQGEFSFLPDLIDMLWSSKINSSRQKRNDDATITRNLLFAIHSLGRAPSMDGIDALTKLTRHKDPFVRRRAISALRQLKNPATIPTLIKVLGDKDPRNQYSAVITLCEINNPTRRGCPSSILFRKEPEKYIRQWKQWWEKEKRRKR